MIARTFIIKTLTTVLLMIGLFITQGHSAELKLVFKSEDGKPVAISKAELLLVAWGYTERVKLETQGTSLTLPIDASWLQSRAPERFQDLEGVYIYLESSGFAPIRSARFGWLGSDTNSTAVTNIKFPGGKELTINKDSKETLGVIFRRPQKKQLKFVDDENNPFSGVKIKVSMFWSASNHCGQLAGVDYLGASESDKNGLVPVPDGDIEYVLEIGSRNAVFKNPSNPAFPDRHILYLNNDYTVVQLHRRIMKPLTMQIVHNGVPAADEMLFACLNDCVDGLCGSCCGFLQKTDNKGAISIPDFYPEMYSRIFFAHPVKKRSLSEAIPLWEMKPVVPVSEIIKVDLK